MSVESIVSTLNKKAIEYLCQDNYLECFRILKKAELIVSSPKFKVDHRFKAITWNNLGVYYKKIGKNNSALDCFWNSLSVDISDYDVLAETHLNILAVLMKQKKFKLAIYHGIQAINLAKSCEDYFVLVTALKNTAEAYQAIGKIEKSYQVLKLALRLSEENIPEERVLVKEVELKIRELKKIEKKFYFEKVKIKESKRFLSNFRSKKDENDLTIKVSKSLGKTPNNNIRTINKSSNRVNDLPLRKKLIKVRSKNLQFRELENKVKNIQTQMRDFEVRYQKLEKLAPFNYLEKKEGDERQVKNRYLFKDGLGENPNERTRLRGKDDLMEFGDFRKQDERDIFGYENNWKMSSNELMYPTKRFPSSFLLNF